MKNLLFISMYPFPLDMGSKQHAFLMLKSLTAQYNVHCILFIPPHQKKPIWNHRQLMNLGIKGYELCYFIENDSAESYTKKLKLLFSFPNYFINCATHREGFATIESCMLKQPVDIILFEHFWLTKYAFRYGYKAKQVVVYHDLHHKIYKEKAALEKTLRRKLSFLVESVKLKVFQHLLEKHISLKIFLNPIEMKSLPKKAVHIPHVVNSKIIYRTPRNTDFFNILFLGSFNHPPNRESFQFILHRILPKLHSLKSKFILHIVGPDTEKFKIRILHSPINVNINIHGFMMDINDVFKKVDIALLPVLSGGGIKTKIIDSLAAGVPVVTTTKGIEGLVDLPDGCVSIANTPEQIVQEIRLLMNSFQLRLKKSVAGKEFIEKAHSYSAFSNKVFETFSLLSGNNANQHSK